MEAGLERNEATQTLVATLENIEELKPKQEECVKLFTKSKDIGSNHWKQSPVQRDQTLFMKWIWVWLYQATLLLDRCLHVPGGIVL